MSPFGPEGPSLAASRDAAKSSKCHASFYIGNMGKEKKDLPGRTLHSQQEAAKYLKIKTIQDGGD